MKKHTLALTLVLGLFSVPAVLTAKSVEQAYVDSFHGVAGTPVPVSVVTPIVSKDYDGKSVDLVFVVDAKGRPRGIRTQSRVAYDLAATIVKAVAQWRFAPVHNADGEPVPTKVRLPVRIVGRANR